MLTSIRNVKFCIAINAMKYNAYHRCLRYILHQPTMAYEDLYEEEFIRSRITLFFHLNIPYPEDY